MSEAERAHYCDLAQNPCVTIKAAVSAVLGLDQKPLASQVLDLAVSAPEAVDRLRVARPPSELIQSAREVPNKSLIGHNPPYSFHLLRQHARSRLVSLRSDSYNMFIVCGPLVGSRVFRHMSCVSLPTSFLTLDHR